MADARVLLALAALLCMALFYMRLGVKSALAPLCAVGTVALGLSLFGALGLLRPFGWALYAFAALCAGFLLWEFLAGRKSVTEPTPAAPFHAARGGRRVRARIKSLRDFPSAALSRPGFHFFLAASLIIIVILWAKKPLFTGWDEFSLWGVDHKLMKLNDELFTTAPTGWFWSNSQKPAYIAFGYFFQFFGADFAEWQAYAACDVFQLAMLAALFVPLEGRLRKTWTIAIPLGLVALLVPYVFQHYQTVQSVSPAWLDTLGDVPLGLCFAAALACGMGESEPQKATVGSLLPAAMALALTAMVKDTGFALALVAAVILAVDWFIKADKNARKPRFLGFALRLAGGLGLVIALFAAWEVYTGALSGTSRLDSAVTTGGVGMLEMPFAFFRDLAGPSPLFTHVITDMAQQFVSKQGNMLGSGLFIALLCLAICAAAALLYKNKAHRLRVGAFAVLSTLGFAAWYWLLTMTYIYIFRADQSAIFESYDRYVYPYYIGWLLGALVLLCVALARGQSRLVPLGRAGLLAFAALLLLRVALLVPMPYTVWGVNTQEYNQRRAFNAKIDALKPYLDPEGRTFWVMSGDLGNGWFMAHHQLLPWMLDYSYGGGELVERDPQPDGTTSLTPVTPDMLADYLVENDITTVYVNFADYDFIQTYGGLFSDGLAAWENDQAGLYTVTVQNGKVTLEPLYWQSVE